MFSLTYTLLNFLNGLVHFTSFVTVHYQFWGYQDENLTLASQQYRAYSESMELYADLALYWWKRLILFQQDKG